MKIKTLTHSKLDILIFILMFLPIIHFYWFVQKYAINVPYLDDFQILNSIVRIQNKPQDFWLILSENFNGHRFGEIKALVYLDYLIEGQVNFKTLCIFGSLFLLGFWGYCLKIIRENNIPIFYFIPFTFIIFNPLFHRNIFWMLSCLQYQQSIFFTIATYYYLAKFTTKSFIIAVILGIIHTQINGNAVYIFLFGALIPLYQGRYKMTLIYGVFSTITGFLFYRNMPTVVGLAGYSLQDLLTSKPTVLLGALGGFLGGSIVQFTNNYHFIAGIGILLFIIIGSVLLVFTILILSHVFKKNVLKSEKSREVLLKFDEICRQRIIMILMAGSLLLTAVGVAISRGIFFNGIMIVDRYMLYSVVSIGIVYLLLIMFTEGRVRQIIGILSIPLSIIFCWNAYYKNTSQVVYFKNSHEADIYNLKHQRTTNNKMYCFTPEVLALFEETLKRKIYLFPSSRFDALEETLSQIPDSKSISSKSFNFSVSSQIQNVYGGVKNIYIHNQDFQIPQTPASNTFFVVLKNESSNHSYLICPSIPIPIRKDYLLKNYRFGTGFIAMIAQDGTPKGLYRIGLLTFINGQPNLQYTKAFINVDNTKLIEWMQTFGYYKYS
jgi:hypothetical protein